MSVNVQPLAGNFVIFSKRRKYEFSTAKQTLHVFCDWVRISVAPDSSRYVSHSSLRGVPKMPDSILAWFEPIWQRIVLAPAPRKQPFRVDTVLFMRQSTFP
jgi:hypothetical protein